MVRGVKVVFDWKLESGVGDSGLEMEWQYREENTVIKGKRGELSIMILPHN